ncbi:MAG: B12-binding domain-containing radical SAM protein, partial [Oscillospiraceae bacterium]|nr:B12-binding domain-containing radical SAM protein [Oscillospiraceae bacterium]
MYFKKIVLVGVNSQYIHSNLAIRYLNKICKINGIDTIMREFTINQRLENVFREIYELKPDLVCFSVYIWNIEFINKIIKLLKIIDKNIIILCGGPEVSFSSKEFLLNSPVDFIIEGEGEETFLDFLNLYPKKDELLEIRGLYSKFQEKIYYLGKRDPLNIDNIPFPYDDEEDLKNKILYYESSRGCPFKCSYCLSSISREVRFRNIEKAKKELKYFTDKKVKLIKFVDRTFNCNQAYSYSIWEYLINDYYRENHETSFHFEISADLFSERELVLLKRAPKGLFQFEIGVQT